MSQTYKNFKELKPHWFQWLRRQNILRMEIYNWRLQTCYSKYAEWVGIWCNSLARFSGEVSGLFWFNTFVSENRINIVHFDQWKTKQGRKGVWSFSTLIHKIPWCSSSSSSREDCSPWNLAEEGRLLAEDERMRLKKEDDRKEPSLCFSKALTSLS